MDPALALCRQNHEQPCLLWDFKLHLKVQLNRATPLDKPKEEYFRYQWQGLFDAEGYDAHGLDAKEFDRLGRSGNRTRVQPSSVGGKIQQREPSGFELPFGDNWVRRTRP